jgi:hypothetical protein
VSAPVSTPKLPHCPVVPCDRTLGRSPSSNKGEPNFISDLIKARTAGWFVLIQIGFPILRRPSQQDRRRSSGSKKIVMQGNIAHRRAAPRRSAEKGGGSLRRGPVNPARSRGNETVGPAPVPPRSCMSCGAAGRGTCDLEPLASRHHIARTATSGGGRAALSTRQPPFARTDVWGSEQSAAMKYYVYISTAKLEMLFPQVPRTLLERFGFDINLKTSHLDAAIRLEEKQVTTMLILERVIAYLDKSNLIGSIDGTKPYMRGELDMRWLGLGPEIVFWAGYHPHIMENHENTVLGLGGSSRHVIGAKEINGRSVADAPGTGAMGSFIDPLLRHLLKPLTKVPLINPSGLPIAPRFDDPDVNPVLRRDGSPYITDDQIPLEYPTMSTVSITAHSMFIDDYYGPTRRLECLLQLLVDLGRPNQRRATVGLVLKLLEERVEILEVVAFHS